MKPTFLLAAFACCLSSAYGRQLIQTGVSSLKAHEAYISYEAAAADTLNKDSLRLERIYLTGRMGRSRLTMPIGFEPVIVDPVLCYGVGGGVELRGRFRWCLNRFELSYHHELVTNGYGEATRVRRFFRNRSSAYSETPYKVAYRSMHGTICLGYLAMAEIPISRSRDISLFLGTGASFVFSLYYKSVWTYTYPEDVYNEVQPIDQAYNCTVPVGIALSLSKKLRLEVEYFGAKVFDKRDTFDRQVVMLSCGYVLRNYVEKRR